MKCRYDTGSMYDNREWCPDEATHAVVYRNGSLPTMTAHVCSRHVGPMEARAYPGHIATAPMVRPLPIHRTEAGYPRCATCDGGGCYDCTDPA